MSKIQDLEARVKELYDRKMPGREPWADWLADNHVWVVADNATELAKRFGGNADLARAAALLHDIADVERPRSADDHEERSLEIARQLMQETGYSPEEIKLVVDDAIRLHSCYDDQRPASQEGKILATADAMAHFLTDFYFFAAREMGADGRSLESFEDWVRKKLERDFYAKIHFDEIREQCRSNYECLKRLVKG